MNPGRKALEAAEYYFMLGKDRTYQKVADKFGVCEGCVARWAVKYHWRESVARRDAEIIKQMQKEDNEKIIKELHDYKKIIRASLKVYIDALKNKEVDVRSVKDLNTLIRLGMDINGVMFAHEDKAVEDTLRSGSEPEKKGSTTALSVSSQSLNTVSKIMAEARRFGGLDEIDEEEPEDNDLTDEDIDALIDEAFDDEEDGDA